MRLEGTIPLIPVQHPDKTLAELNNLLKYELEYHEVNPFVILCFTALMWVLRHG
jgi:hypothetical protein